MQTEKQFDQYIMFDLKVLHPDIWYFENAMSYPEMIAPFVEEMDKDFRSYVRIPGWQNWTASDDASVIYGATKTIRPDYLRDSTGDDRLDQKTLYVINSITMAAEMCFDRYMDGHGLDKSKYRLDLDSIQFKKWNAGQSMGPHFDGQDGDTSLAFSMVSYINDDYEGGEISFPDHNITLKPKAGSLIMFPSQMPFMHEVKQIRSGTRYMVPHLVYNK